MFKFTIREAILMTTIVAVLLMWWMERSHNAKYEARLTAIETRLGSSFVAFGPVVPVAAQPPAAGTPTISQPRNSNWVAPGTTIPPPPIVRPGTITTTPPSEPPPPIVR